MKRPYREEAMSRVVDLKRRSYVPCWEILGCTRSECAARDRPDEECWGLPETQCQAHLSPGLYGQGFHCLLCPLFKKVAEEDPRGWNHFVRDALRHKRWSFYDPAFYDPALPGAPYATGSPDGFPIRRRLEESLRESQRKLSTLISNLPGMAYRCLNDTNWTMEFISEGCLALTGYAATELIGNRVLSYNDLILEADQGLVWDQIQTALRANKPFQLEYRIRTATEEEKWVWEQGRGVFSDSGRLLALEGFITDITARKRLEEDLIASENKYRRVFEGSKDMIFIVSSHGAIKDVNQAGVELLKYRSKKELLSLDSAERIFDNVVHWKVFCQQMERHGFVKDFEAGFRKSDGTRIHCLLSGSAITDKEGRLVGYEAIAKDFTARIDAARNLQRRHQKLQLLHSVALAMNRTRDLDEILRVALRNALESLGLKAGAIFLINRDRGSFELRAQQGLSTELDRQSTQVEFSDVLLMGSLLKKNIFLKPEASFPPFSVHVRGKIGSNPPGFTCFLITTKDKASGFLALQVPPQRDLATGQDFRLLGSLGNFLGNAIENARLLRAVEEHREELKRLTARLFHSQEQERKRIAQELHDEAGQSLTGVNFILEIMEKKLPPGHEELHELFVEIKRQLLYTHEEMRRLSHRLHPLLLSDLGLEPALESYLTAISKRSGLEVDFKMVGFDERLDPETETLLYRLSQEAFTNVLKHARARRFKLAIIRSYPHIVFLAEDDGVGFDLSHLGNGEQALGLLGMRERAAMLGGTFSVRSFEGTGTRIRIEIPIQDRLHG